MPFIPPMLCTRLQDPARLAGQGYIAEPKLDGQRAQVHIEGGRTAHCYSRPGLELLRHPGFAWLRQMTWPVDAAVLDGEAVAGDGHAGIQSVFTERNKPGGAMAVVLFDLLTLNGQSVMRETWMSRRKRLEEAFDAKTLSNVSVVPVTEDTVQLWDTWVGGWGGEGIVLKDPASHYRPGLRSPAWLKVKPKLTLEVVVTGGDPLRIVWGDWGEAVNLGLAYQHPRTGTTMEIVQAVRIRRDEPFELRVGARAEVVCWGVMPSGMLRHPLFGRWIHP